jgi:hypothetical protein
MPDLEDDDLRARLDTLEAFVSDVADWAETLELLAGRWGGAEGAALGEYARQIRVRTTALGMNRKRN